jgi:predicted secreted protein
MADPTPAPDAHPSSTAPRARPHQRDMGGLVFGLILLAVGGYFLLTETLGLDLPDIGEFWPVFVIGLGVWILVSSSRGGRS